MWTEVPGRESAPQRQRSPRHSSPVSFVAMAMATWSCNGASSRCYSTASSRGCSTASSQRYNAAARVAATLRRCCNTCRGSVTALLQHASRQRYGAVAARVAATLRRCCSTRRSNATALLQHASRQRYGVVAARVAGALRRCCSTRRGNPAAARGAAALL